MKKMVLMGAMAVVLAIGFFSMKKVFMGKRMNADLVIVNDTAETASCAFMKDGKMMSEVMKSGERVSGGRGLIRVFTAKKDGSYELQYPYPRPAGKISEVSLTRIIAAPQKSSMDQELYTKKGMIEDIQIDYEEIKNID
jgi:hypothetical protein